jgi:hypothetical protein
MTISLFARGQAGLVAIATALLSACASDATNNSLAGLRPVNPSACKAAPAPIHS